LQKPFHDGSDELFPEIRMNFLPILQSANLWLHLVSMAVWVGGMAFFLFVFGPAVHSLAPTDGIRALNHGRESLQTLSWIAVHLLFLTGVLNFFFRLTAVGVYPESGYYWTLGLKLLLFSAMIFHHFLQSLKYAPRIASATMETGPGGASWPEPLLALWKKWFVLLKINTALGAIVLFLGLALTGR
jgi:putative copper export protein